MADETLLSNGGGAATTIHFGEAASGESALSPGKNTKNDDDAAALKAEIEALKAERSLLEANLGGAREKLAVAEADLKTVSEHVVRLEGELRVTRDDLNTANIAAVDAEEETRALKESVKVLEAAKADLEVKVAGLEARAKVLEQRVLFTEEKAKEAAEELTIKSEAKEKELLVAVKDLEERNAKLEVEVAELRSSKFVERDVEINGKEDAKALAKDWCVMQSQALKAATVFGVAAVVAATAGGVFLQLSKPR